MVVKSIQTFIEDWELLDGEYIPPKKIGEKVGYLIGKHNINNENACIISGTFHIYSETDFTLDLTVVSKIDFENEDVLTVDDVYALYKEAKLKWRYEILQAGIKAGYNNPMILIDVTPLPFHTQELDIQKAILQSQSSKN